MVKILAFYDAWFGCYTTDRRTDRILEFNTSLIDRGKNFQYGLIINSTSTIEEVLVLYFVSVCSNWTTQMMQQLNQGSLTVSFFAIDIVMPCT
jgi:hypothetical protein